MRVTVDIEFWSTSHLFEWLTLNASATFQNTNLGVWVLNCITDKDCSNWFVEAYFAFGY
jgi:hypothetical protein